jgi:hypothetical protein
MRRGGNVFIREAGQDRRYRAEAIGSHHELVRLAERGAESRRIAHARFEEGRLPFTEEALGIRYTTAATGDGRTFRTRYSEHAQIILRLVPLTLLPRLEDWAMSEAAVEACRAIGQALTDEQCTVEDPVPHPRGVAVAARDGESRTLNARGGTYRRYATAVVDAGGMIGVSLHFSVQASEHERLEFDRERGRQEFLDPPMTALAAALEDHEFYGRTLCQLDIERLGDVAIVFRNGPQGPAGHLPLGGELTMPALGSGWRSQCRARTRSAQRALVIRVKSLLRTR